MDSSPQDRVGILNIYFIARAKLIVVPPALVFLELFGQKSMYFLTVVAMMQIILNINAETRQDLSD